MDPVLSGENAGRRLQFKTCPLSTMKETVTVIIPTYNRASTIHRALDSVLSQTHRGFELIVVDDGSEDHTFRIIRDLGSRVRYVRQERSGPSAARNLGIRMARTDLFAFLDSDDWWDEDKLSVQLEEMEKKPEYLISHTQEIWYRNGNLLTQKKKHRKYHGHIFDTCLPICAVSMSTVVARRDLFDEVGMFDESLPCCEDYDFWLRASVRHPFLLVDEPLTLKEGGRPDQVSWIHRRGMDSFRIQSLLKILGEPALLDDAQRNLALRELERKCRIYGNGCMKHGKAEEGNYYLTLPGKFGKRGGAS
jgi:glycosyltransferase involved in cell wall biosynthesis